MMTTDIQEKYAFLLLSHIDLGIVSTNLELLPTINDPTIRAALIRDAAISYAKPFSKNRGARSKLTLKMRHVPKELRAEHREIVKVRDTLIAHNDLSLQNLSFGPGHSFTVKGYARPYLLDNLLTPLSELAQDVQSGVIRELFEIQDSGKL